MPGDGRCRQATRECPKVRRDVRTLANAPCCLALLETPVRGEIPQEPAPIEEGVPYARGRKRAMRARWSGSRDGREGGRNAIANFQAHSRRGSEENMEFEASAGSWMSRIPTNQCSLSWQLSPAWWGACRSWDGGVLRQVPLCPTSKLPQQKKSYGREVPTLASIIGDFFKIFVSSYDT